jgi:hypothetical protein
MSILQNVWMRVGVFVCFVLMALIAGIPGVSGIAQSAAWSRGIQKLAIKHDECKDRARRALEAEGYRIANHGGDLTGDYYFGGDKSNHTAAIACNSSPDGQTWANIFVTTTFTPDGNVPGDERVRLQQRMEQKVQRGCGLGSKWTILTDGGWTGSWSRRGQSDVFDGVWRKGSDQFTAVLTITLMGNAVRVQRRNATLGGDCEFNGMVGDDGLTVSGTNVCTHGQGPATLKIECQ